MIPSVGPEAGPQIVGGLSRRAELRARHRGRLPGDLRRPAPVRAGLGFPDDRRRGAGAVVAAVSHLPDADVVGCPGEGHLGGFAKAGAVQVFLREAL